MPLASDEEECKDATMRDFHQDSEAMEGKISSLVCMQLSCVQLELSEL